MGRKLIYFVIGFVTALGLGIYVFGKLPPPLRSSTESLSVAASFYPLQFFTEQIAGSGADVISLTPPGVEPHGYELTPLAIAKLYNSRLIVLNGAGLEPWIERLQDDLKKKTRVLVMSEQINVLPGTSDPHFWLDPLLAQTEVELIRDALGTVAPSRVEQYSVNSQTFLARLRQIHQEYEAGLSNCELRAIVAPHNAFSYLAARYNFQVIPLRGTLPESESSPRQLAEVIREARARGIKVIFTEPLLDDRTAASIAREIGGTTAILNPIETLTAKDYQDGSDYFSIMRANLNELRRAMLCR